MAKNLPCRHIFFFLIFVLTTGSMKGGIPKTDELYPNDTVQERTGLVQKILGYFEDSNKNKVGDKFDFSIIGGPHYSSDTKLGLGLAASGLYRSVPGDSLTPQSNVSLYGDISSVGFALIGIRGFHIFPSDRYRLNYKVYFFSFPGKFWGIGYSDAINDSNETDYKRLQAKVEADFMFRLAKNFYLGPSAQFCFVEGKNIHKNQWLWHGESLRTKSYGVGVTLSYDSRDNINNSFEGYFISLEQRFFPRFLFNDYPFSATEFTANKYNRVWKGGVVAMQLHGNFTYGNTPWGMLADIGGSNSMRGYYEGRYRDKCEVDATVELRQHIYGRSGAVLWVGAGSVFPQINAIRFKRILPNYGIGYRWEFKHRVNVRLDLGFGRHQTGFVFNINEAF